MLKRNVLAVMTAIALLPFGAGCSTKTQQRKGATLEVDLSTSYAIEKFQMRGGDVYPISVVDNGVIVGKYTPKKDYYYLYDAAADTFTEFPKERKESPSYTGQLPDGRYIFLYNDSLGRKGGMDIRDGKHRSADIFDQELKLVESFSLPEEMPIGIITGYSLTMDKAGNWLFYNDNEIWLTYNENANSDSDADTSETEEEWKAGYYVLNPDFTVKGELDYDDYAMNNVTVGRSGLLYGTVTDKFYRIDCESMKVQQLDYKVPSNMNLVMTGEGEYELFCNQGDGIYGMREDGTQELVVDFWNSDLTNTVWSSWALHDGTFIVNYHDDNSGSFSHYRLRRRSEEEIAQTKLISLAGVNIDQRLLKEVTAFNQSQNEYRIVMKDYGREWAQTTDDPDVREELMAWEWRDANIDFTPAVEIFKSDLLAGTVPDIICMDDIPYQLISNKGILTDLMPLLQADTRFDESLYLQNILGSLKRGERLERIGFSFRVDTLVAKTEFVGEKQWHTADEYIEMLKNIPEGMYYFPMNSREEVTDYFLVQSQGTYIDRESMTCRFNSPAFVSLLELVNSMQPSERLYASNQDYWDAMEYGYNYSENHTLLYPFSIFRPINYHSIHYRDFGKADITLVGYPESAGGNGGMFEMDYTIALTSQSDRAEPVMDFIMTELSKQRQSKVCLENWQSCSLPLMREQLEYALLAATRGYHDGGNLNEQEMAVLQDYIEGVKMYRDIDPSISAIIKEESGKYFAGDCTAQEAGDMIQSRVSIYLAEQK